MRIQKCSACVLDRRRRTTRSSASGSAGGLSPVRYGSCRVLMPERQGADRADRRSRIDETVSGPGGHRARHPWDLRVARSLFQRNAGAWCLEPPSKNGTLLEGPSAGVRKRIPMRHRNERRRMVVRGANQRSTRSHPEHREIRSTSSRIASTQFPCAITRPLRGPGRIGQVLEQTMVEVPV